MHKHRVTAIQALQSGRHNELGSRIIWRAELRNEVFLNQEGYLKKLVLHVTWPSFGNATVCGLKSTAAILQEEAYKNA
jgi:hypothetical protein